MAGRPDPVGVRDLRPYELALFTGGFTTRAQIDEHLARHGIHPPHAVETNSITALIDVVRRTPWSPCCRTASPGSARSRAPCRSPPPCPRAPPSCSVARPRTRAPPPGPSASLVRDHYGAP
ncbi:LysR substrate-binding domain-containing protein [Streptomyces noursei]|uniref:LysR substrate-binding domain-containing protein n=1 Tax=Streptomyces noursei TaxID=1971 RepID=UPI003328A727